MLARFVVRALFAAVGLWLASEIVPGVRFASLGTLAAAAILLGVVNALVRPVVFLLTLPLTIVTLGLWLLVINGLMVWLVALLLHGFHLSGLFAGIGVAIVTGLVSWLGGMLLHDERR